MAISDAPPQLRPWLRHVASLRKKHPQMKYKALLKLASKSYKSKAVAKKKKPVKRKTGTKKPKRKTGAKKKPKKYYGKTKRPYLRGAAWHADHYQVNKGESWEVPRSKRKHSVYN